MAGAEGGRFGGLRRRLASWFPDREGNAVGLVLVFAWVAYPFTAFVTQSNSNDELISALLVWSLVFFASPLARGGLLAAASLAKFAPLPLVPLYAAGGRDPPPQPRRPPRSCSGRSRSSPLVPRPSLLLLAYPAVDPGPLASSGSGR